MPASHSPHARSCAPHASTPTAVQLGGVEGAGDPIRGQRAGDPRRQWTGSSKLGSLLRGVHGDPDFVRFKMRLRNGLDQGPGLVFFGEVRAPVSAPRTIQAGSARTIVDVSRGIRSWPVQVCAGLYPFVRIVLGQFRIGTQLVQSSHRENVDLTVKNGDLDPASLLIHSSYPAARMMARRLEALLPNGGADASRSDCSMVTSTAMRVSDGERDRAVRHHRRHFGCPLRTLCSDRSPLPPCSAH